jgi:probable F420-dependent oxidoreductase
MASDQGETEGRLALAPIGVWTGALDVVPVEEAQQLAAELEDLGYGAIWLPEVAGRDVMMHLALLLSATDRLVGATGIASIWGRDAVTMTGGVKGLTEAFPERVLLGLGVSHHTLVEGLRGHAYDRPLATMAAYLDAMDASPYTAFRPTTPVRRVLAALRPKMLALSGKRTDGAHTYLVPPEHTVGARSHVGPGALLCVEQAVLLESDPAAARTIGRAHTAVYVRLPNYRNNLLELGFEEADFAEGGSDRLVDAIVAWGDEEAVRTRVQAQFDAGADHVCIQALSAQTRRVPTDQWRRLAPVLRDLASRLASG